MQVKIYFFIYCFQEIKRIDLAPLSRNDCKALLRDWGFKRADESEETSDNARSEF